MCDIDEKGGVSYLVTDDERSLLLEDKIDLIDCELRTLIEFCKSNGYSSNQIYLAAKPFLKDINHNKSQRRQSYVKHTITVLAVCLIVFGLVFHVDRVNRLSTYIYRKTLIGLLPYWDWTDISQRQCMVYNEYYRENKIFEDDCAICESFDEIPRRENVSDVMISETYLRGDLPVIVTDGMHGWDIGDMSLSQLNEFFRGEGIRDYMGCVLSSNVRVRRGHHLGLLHKVTSGEVGSFYAHWENCFKEASKVFRQLYKRPYFLPLMVELDDSNWVFISRDFHAKMYKEVDTRATMVMFAQVTGRFKVRLTPKQPCDRTCDHLTATLNQGDMLIVPNFLWLLDYLPFEDGENMAVGISGNFDWFQ